MRNFSGTRWLCMEESGARYRIDMAALSVAIEFPVELLRGTERSLAIEDAAPVTRSFGGFLNYDVRADRTDGITSVGASWEVGAFGPPGILTSSSFTGDAGRGTTRLDTAFRRDDPVSITSFVAGDTITRAGNYGAAVRMGGFQYARNFGNAPLLVTYPAAEVHGTAVVPSTVDIFVNNARTYSTNVTPGPFSISNLPVPVGAGNVQVIVRDVFGKETTAVVPFVRYDTLLRAGLSDFSFEGGWLRRNYAVVSNDYGGFAGVGTYRYGISDGLTVEGRAEAMSDRANIGGAVQFTVPVLGLATIAAAGSTSDALGRGTLGKLQLLRRERAWSYALSAEERSSGFADIAFEPGQVRTLSVRQFSASTRIGQAQWLNVLGLRTRDTSGEFTTATLGWSVSLPRSITLTANLTRFGGNTAPSTTVFSLALSVPFGERDYAVASVEKRSDASRPDGLLQVSRNVLEGDSIGYRLIAGSQSGERRLEGALLARTGFGEFALEAADSFGTTSQRATARGAIAMAGGAWRPSRYLDSSFAIVKVADFPGVEVFANNQSIARTDANGEAMVPRLTGFLPSRLAFEAEDIPLEGVFRENFRMIKIPTRMGALVDLGVRRLISATLTLQRGDGRPVPSGSTARLEGVAEEFPVARGGRVYVSGLQRDKPNAITVQIGEAQCRANIQLPEGFASGASLGPYTCN